MMAEAKHTSASRIKRILGLFVSKEFEVDHKSFNNLKEEFAVNYEEGEDEEDELFSNV